MQGSADGSDNGWDDRREGWDDRREGWDDRREGWDDRREGWYDRHAGRDDERADTDDRVGPGGPTRSGAGSPDAVRTWVHPSELGREQRDRTDRRRGSLLAGGLVIGGIGLLVAGVLMGFGWGDAERPAADSSPVDALSPSLASVTVVRGAQQSTATGVVLDDQGNLAVRAGALDGATELWAACAGRAPVRAQVVAVDRQADVAVVRMSMAAGRPVVNAPNPDTGQSLMVVRAGSGEEAPSSWQTAVATVRVNLVLSDGSVSDAMFRTSNAPEPRATSTMLTTSFAAPPTSASVSVDSTDGAVFDGRGRFLGLVVATDGEGQDVIPATTVYRVARSLLDTGKVDLPWLGLWSADAAADAAHPQGTGAVITSVVPAGPAERSGLQVGDRVVAVGAATVNRMVDLEAALRQLDIGSTVSLSVIRDGTRRTMSITTATLPTPATATAGP